MKRRDPELWAEVLQETNQYRRQLIDQVSYSLETIIHWQICVMSVSAKVLQETNWHGS